LIAFAFFKFLYLNDEVIHLDGPDLSDLIEASAFSFIEDGQKVFPEEEMGLIPIFSEDYKIRTYFKDYNHCYDDSKQLKRYRYIYVYNFSSPIKPFCKIEGPIEIQPTMKPENAPHSLNKMSIQYLTNNKVPYSLRKISNPYEVNKIYLNHKQDINNFYKENMENISSIHIRL